MESTVKRTSFIAAGILAILLAFSVFGFAQQAEAAEYAAGSAKVQANASSSKKVVKGTLKSGSKITKTFVMPSDGYVTFTVRIPKGLGSTALRIDYKGIRYVSTNISNGSLGSGKFTSDRFSIRPGAKFRVTLELPGSIIRQSLRYTITMKHKVPARYEVEKNNSKATASKLELGKESSGNILKNGLDWFVFEAPSDGVYKVQGRMALFSSGATTRANMTLYNGQTSYGIRFITSGNDYTRLGQVTLKKGEKVYVEITPSLLGGNVSASYFLKATAVK